MLPILYICIGMQIRIIDCWVLCGTQWYTRGWNFWLKTYIFSFWPSVSAAEFKGWKWPNVKFYTFKNILPGKLFWINTCTYWIQLQFGEKSSHMAEKIRLFARYAKSPLIFTYIVHSVSVSVFGLRPDVFPARYSVRPKVKNIPSVIHCGQQHHIWNMFGIYISFLFSTPENLSQFSIVPLKCCAWKNWKK